MAKVTCCYPGANMDLNELAHEPTAACYRRLRMFKAGGVAQLEMCHPGMPWVSAGVLWLVFVLGGWGPLSASRQVPNRPSRLARRSWTYGRSFRGRR